MCLPCSCHVHVTLSLRLGSSCEEGVPALSDMFQRWPARAMARSTVGQGHGPSALHGVKRAIKTTTGRPAASPRHVRRTGQTRSAPSAAMHGSQRSAHRAPLL
eukprot:3732583-Heterocapsa_arctica.AAC.1